MQHHPNSTEQEHQRQLAMTELDEQTLLALQQQLYGLQSLSQFKESDLIRLLKSHYNASPVATNSDENQVNF